MAISFVASTRSPTSFPGASNNTSSINVAKPANTADGDLMIAYCQSGNVVHSPPGGGGWTLLSAYQHSTANLTSTIYYRIASSEGTSYTFTDDAGGITPMSVQILTYRGVDPDDPIDQNVTSETASTDTVAAPSATSTGPGWYVWFRTGKTSTVLSEGDFAITGGTPRQKSSNRGGSVQYFVESADSNGNLSQGSNAGASFNADVVLTGSNERTIVLRDPKVGTITSSVPAVTSSFAGEREPNSGSIDASTPSVTSSMTGTHYVPATGAIDSTIPLVQAELEGHSDLAGQLDASVPLLSVALVGETVPPDSEHVIKVEADHRAFLVVDDGITDTGLKPIKRSRVTDA